MPQTQMPIKEKTKGAEEIYHVLEQENGKGRDYEDNQEMCMEELVYKQGHRKVRIGGVSV